jgi:hypothetical protein
LTNLILLLEYEKEGTIKSPIITKIPKTLT